MAAASGDDDLDPVYRGKGGTGAHADLAEWQPVGQVQAQSGSHRSTGKVQHPIIQHRLGAVEQLLRRLEHQEHGAGDLGAACRQDLCHR